MKAKPKSKSSIREFALEIRAILQLKSKDFVDIVRILELTITQALNLDFVVVPKNEMKNKYAEYNPIEKTIYVREDTYNNAIMGIGRDRFTIAHEIGHVFYHSNNVTLARSDEDIPIYCDPEWQANTFAREFLCPITGITEEDTIEDIAKRFGVSKEVASIQLNEKK